MEIDYKPKSIAPEVGTLSDKCPHCGSYLQKRKEHRIRPIKGSVEYIRVAVQAVKCPSCYAKYLFELKKTNIYILAGFNNRDKAKSMGAMFDRDLKMWYVSANAPEHVKLSILSQFKVVKIDFDDLAREKTEEGYFAEH